MQQCIIRILEALLRLLQPPPPAYRIPAPPAYVNPEPDTRPGPAPERALWLAMYGVDLRHCSNRGLERTA
ncbi:hypothetical protein [Streptomyces sp. S584]|uniref:hypothetical protein n=1 Tax=Streptomyces sp. S584 TaxID=3096010 RepID=UPI002AFDD249|nr:hypothetical protein [Streptomyces sp. S584]